MRIMFRITVAGFVTSYAAVMGTLIVLGVPILEPVRLSIIEFLRVADWTHWRCPARVREDRTTATESLATSRRQMGGEGRSPPEHALDRQAAAVAIEDVLDQRQTEPGST